MSVCTDSPGWVVGDWKSACKGTVGLGQGLAQVSLVLAIAGTGISPAFSQVSTQPPSRVHSPGLCPGRVCFLDSSGVSDVELLLFTVRGLGPRGTVTFNSPQCAE